MIEELCFYLIEAKFVIWLVWQKLQEALEKRLSRLQKLSNLLLAETKTSYDKCQFNVTLGTFSRVLREKKKHDNLYWKDDKACIFLL